MQIRSVFIAALGFGEMLFSLSAEAASTLALDFAQAFERAPNANSNYGWAFSISSAITVDGLGLWDDGSDGLMEPHDVGLWRTSGPIGVPVLLASETVSNNDSTPVASMSKDGRWLFSDIAPLKLDPGTYIVGALYHAGPTGAYDPFVSDSLTILTTSGVEYGSTREVHNTPTLTCPMDFGLNEHNGFFGPNFRVVPEPSAVILAGLGGLLLLKRRQRSPDPLRVCE